MTCNELYHNNNYKIKFNTYCATYAVHTYYKGFTEAYRFFNWLLVGEYVSFLLCTGKFKPTNCNPQIYNHGKKNLAFFYPPVSRYDWLIEKNILVCFNCILKFAFQARRVFQSTCTEVLFISNSIKAVNQYMFSETWFNPPLSTVLLHSQDSSSTSHSSVRSTRHSDSPFFSGWEERSIFFFNVLGMYPAVYPITSFSL